MTRTTVIRSYLVAFMLVMAFLAYMCFTQPMATDRPEAQRELHSQVPDATVKAQPVDKGDAFITMQIPRFGEQWYWTVLEGTSLDVLNKGPGHFIGTPLPGQNGNSAYAAHRSTHGDPFIDFDKLVEGDTITLRQGKAEWPYKVTQEPRIIGPDESWVLDEFAPGKWLTLTTCWPKYGSEKRMFVRAKLTKLGVDNAGQ